MKYHLSKSVTQLTQLSISFSDSLSLSLVLFLNTWNSTELSHPTPDMLLITHFIDTLYHTQVKPVSNMYDIRY